MEQKYWNIETNKWINHSGVLEPYSIPSFEWTFVFRRPHKVNSNTPLILRVCPSHTPFLCPTYLFVNAFRPFECQFNPFETIIMQVLVHALSIRISYCLKIANNYFNYSHDTLSITWIFIHQTRVFFNSWPLRIAYYVV